MLFRKLLSNNYSLWFIAQRYYGTDVALIGCPFAGGQTKDGAEKFPKLIREKGIISNIESLNRRVIDYGDVEVPKYSNQKVTTTRWQGKELKNTKECGTVSKRLATLVEEGARNDKVCVTLGGDHSIATGSLIGHCRARDNLCVIWVDAHNDLNTHKTTLSGNLHGMCLSFVIKGLTDVTGIPGYEWTKPCLSPRDIVYIGIRDSDPAESEVIEKLGIPMFRMDDIDLYGISGVMERALEMINPKLDRPIHISYDVDSLDPKVCPGTGTPVPGGLTLSEGLYIGEYVNKLGLLGGLDIVEVNPSLCNSQADVDLTMNTAMSIIETCLGKQQSTSVHTIEASSDSNCAKV